MLCEDPDLEQAAGVLLAQVNVDHLEQPLDLVVAHLAVLVLVGPLQVAPDPSFRGSRNRFQVPTQSVKHLKALSLVITQQVIRNYPDLTLNTACLAWNRLFGLSTHPDSSSCFLSFPAGLNMIAESGKPILCCNRALLHYLHPYIHTHRPHILLIHRRVCVY